MSVGVERCLKPTKPAAIVISEDCGPARGSQPGAQAGRHCPRRSKGGGEILIADQKVTGDRLCSTNFRMQDTLRITFIITYSFIPPVCLAQRCTGSPWMNRSQPTVIIALSVSADFLNYCRKNVVQSAFHWLRDEKSLIDYQALSRSPKKPSLSRLHPVGFESRRGRLKRVPRRRKAKHCRFTLICSRQ